jgi:hypothetical protein
MSARRDGCDSAVSVTNGPTGAQQRLALGVGPFARGQRPGLGGGQVLQVFLLVGLRVDERQGRVPRRQQAAVKRGLAGAIGPGDQVQDRHAPSGCFGVLAALAPVGGHGLLGAVGQRAGLGQRHHMALQVVQVGRQAAGRSGARV